MSTFERIQELAKKRNKNLKEISLELGFSKNYLYTLKTQDPSADKLGHLADYFSVTTDYLLGRNETPVWATDFETIELQELLRGNHSLAYNEGEVTEEDRKAIDNMITGYYWHKQQEEKN